jgi:hypothetical protein
MSNIDTANQTDWTPLSIGEFHTGTGRVRQTPGKIYTSKEKKKNPIC